MVNSESSFINLHFLFSLIRNIKIRLTASNYFVAVRFLNDLINQFTSFLYCSCIRFALSKDVILINLAFINFTLKVRKNLSYVINTILRRIMLCF